MTLDCQLDANGNPKHEKHTPKYVGCKEQMEIKRVRQIETNAPDPWLSRKLAVGIVVAIFGYSYYVFVVRLCVPMIRMQKNRLGARAQGLVYLVVFHFLFVLFCWSYLVAIFTPPGFARDYVPKSDPPVEDAQYVTVAGQRFEDQPLSPRMQPRPMEHEPKEPRVGDDENATESGGAQASPSRRPSSQDGQGTTARPVMSSEEDTIAENAPSVGALGPDIATALTSVADAITSRDQDAPVPSSSSDARDVPEPPNATSQSSSTTTRATLVNDPGSMPAPPARIHVANPSSATAPVPIARIPSTATATNASFLHFPEPPEDYEPPQRLKVERIPPVAPVLKLQYRYDPREEIVRPYRSHRCRHCAAIVLKMDHHCPWVGTCVGARNYKYFYNFLQASTLYTLFVFLALVIAQTLPLSSFEPPERPYPGVDGQQVAIIALSFLFFLFTSSLWGAHTRMIANNLTTIEEMGVNRMRQKERNALQSVYGFWNFRAKKETRRAWDRKWGRLGKEGNLWWLGSHRANWEMVMGQHKLGWIFPIPARPTPDDGLHYVPNPRFDRDGVWRPRRDWPVELRELGLEHEKSGGNPSKSKS